jgi:hypothetical protein
MEVMKRTDTCAGELTFKNRYVTNVLFRFQSGFFFRHPLLDPYEYYWRIEPDVNFYCDVDYDVFQMMKDNKFKYGNEKVIHSVAGC